MRPKGELHGKPNTGSLRCFMPMGATCKLYAAVEGVANQGWHRRVETVSSECLRETFDL